MSGSEPRVAKERSQLNSTPPTTSPLSNSDQNRTGTDKSESFNDFVEYLAFGDGGVIAENNRAEQHKIIKFNHPRRSGPRRLSKPRSSSLRVSPWWPGPWRCTRVRSVPTGQSLTIEAMSDPLGTTMSRARRRSAFRRIHQRFRMTLWSGVIIMRARNPENMTSD